MLGLGFTAALVLGVLKLAGVVAVSWWIVMAPVALVLGLLVAWYWFIGGLLIALTQVID